MADDPGNLAAASKPEDTAEWPQECAKMDLVGRTCQMNKNIWSSKDLESVFLLDSLEGMTQP